MTCIPYGGAIVCGVGPRKEIHRESLGVRWCFYCRKRVEIIYTLTDDVEPSYYEPNPGIHCVHGHWNGDLFPGRERLWD